MTVFPSIQTEGVGPLPSGLQCKSNPYFFLNEQASLKKAISSHVVSGIEPHVG